jgi:glycosyltransferase involved in cell wall biosynthesis
MKILFLYTELAEYTLACIRALKNSSDSPEVLVIHYPANPEAPFKFDLSLTGKFISTEKIPNYSVLKKEVDCFSPDKIVVSGWANKNYLRICRYYRSKARCILTMDNRWNGSIKQHILKNVFGITLKKIFAKIWIPGSPQREYAKKLGFGEDEIMEGFYCCDTGLYIKMGKAALERKKSKFPKKFLCVARYIPQKNYELLWGAFAEWKRISDNDWELWCAGAGENFDDRMIHPAIKHLGFVHKEDLPEIIAETGIFILPSLFEPWAVAVQEFAAAGYPLILSTKVGAASVFLDADNGWTFPPNDRAALINIFDMINKLGTEDLGRMCLMSVDKANQLTPQKWVLQLLFA